MRLHEETCSVLAMELNDSPRWTTWTFGLGRASAWARVTVGAAAAGRARADVTTAAPTAIAVSRAVRRKPWWERVLLCADRANFDLHMPGMGQRSFGKARERVLPPLAAPPPARWGTRAGCAPIRPLVGEM